MACSGPFCCIACIVLNQADSIAGAIMPLWMPLAELSEEWFLHLQELKSKLLLHRHAKSQLELCGVCMAFQHVHEHLRAWSMELGAHANSKP